MANDNFSCVKEVTKSVPFTLSISYQENEITGISDALESWKGQYIQILQGIVVSYKNVSLLSKYAYIKSDYPVILCNVKATFELFTPSVGSVVKGIVNRISHDYIGCLIHNTINVAINRFDNADDASSFIALDNVILFEITHLGYKRKIIKVKGKITQDCVNLMKQLNISTVASSTVTNNRVIYSFNDDSTDSNIDTESHSLFNDSTVAGKTSDYSSDLGSNSPKKKNKKSKNEPSTSSLYESVIENYDESQSLLDNNSRLTAEDLSDTSHSKKKKHKKSKKDVQSSPSIFSDSSSKEDIKPFKAPLTPPKKKKNKSLAKFSPSKSVNSINLAILHNTYEDAPSDLLSSVSPLKLNHEFSLHDDNFTVGSSVLNQPTNMQLPYIDSVLNKDKSMVMTKKAKKRKRESLDTDGLPKKRKKLDGEGSKHKGDKTKKKNKDKSKKDSKKDKKKKSKNKVISSKKKLPKMKKKNKDKAKKLKNKTKKSSKHKKEDA